MRKKEKKRTKKRNREEGELQKEASISQSSISLNEEIISLNTSEQTLPSNNNNNFKKNNENNLIFLKEEITVFEEDKEYGFLSAVQNENKKASFFNETHKIFIPPNENLSRKRNRINSFDILTYFQNDEGGQQQKKKTFDENDYITLFDNSFRPTVIKMENNDDKLEEMIMMNEDTNSKLITFKQEEKYVEFLDNF